MAVSSLPTCYACLLLRLQLKILRWIGRGSYGIYLYHFPISLALWVLIRERLLAPFRLLSVKGIPYFTLNTANLMSSLQDSARQNLR
jgi:peptidoglycan/LPS O-acetylase OafA/YrhL